MFLFVGFENIFDDVAEVEEEGIADEVIIDGKINMENYWYDGADSSSNEADGEEGFLIAVSEVLHHASSEWDGEKKRNKGVEEPIFHVGEAIYEGDAEVAEVGNESDVEVLIIDHDVPVFDGHENEHRDNKADNFLQVVLFVETFVFEVEFKSKATGEHKKEGNANNKERFKEGGGAAAFAEEWI